MGLLTLVMAVFASCGGESGDGENAASSLFIGLALSVIPGAEWKGGVVVMALAILIVVGVEICVLLSMRRSRGGRERRVAGRGPLAAQLGAAST